MASTTRPPARKKAAARPPAPPAAFEPVRIVADEDVVEERATLFYIGDVEYTVPTTVPVGIALEYLRVARNAGSEAGAGALLSRALGEEAYLALEQSRGLTSDQLLQIVEIVLDLSLGKAEREGKARKS